MEEIVNPFRTTEFTFAIRKVYLGYPVFDWGVRDTM